MAASIICSVHIIKAIFTKQNCDEFINERNMSFPHVTSSVGWNLFIG